MMIRKTGKSFKLFRTRSTMLIMVVLLLSIGVAVGVVEIITQMASKKMKQQADQLAELQAHSIGRVVESSFVTSTWVANSFLAAMMHIQYVEDSLTGERNTLHYLSNVELQKLNVNKLYQSLSDFLVVNSEFYAAALIFEPGIVSDAPERGVAALVRRDNNGPVDLLDSADIFNHPLYEYGHHCSHGYISDVTRHEATGVLVITYVCPILDENGRMIGEFWMDYPLQRLSCFLKKQETKLNAFSFVLDRNLTIIACSDYYASGERFGQYLPILKGGDLGTVEIKSFKRKLEKKQQFKSRVIINGEYCYCYFYPLETTDFTLVICIAENRILQIVDRFKGKMLTVSMAGLLIALLCSGFAFQSYRKKEGDSLRMQGELDIASKIQQNFLPSVRLRHEKADVFAFQRSARQVGGDLYDYVERDNKLFFCVGDVSGKGVPASLFMAIASSHFRSICRYEDDSARIVSHLNRCLADRNHSEMFCTMFLGVLDLESGLLSYCNAGHNPPVLKTAEDCRYLAVKTNMMLGAFEEYAYESQCLNLTSGNSLFVYTDGVTEAFAADGSLFGEKRLIQLVNSLPIDTSAEDLCQRVADAVTIFARGEEQSDDITMLCLKMV